MASIERKAADAHRSERASCMLFSYNSSLISSSADRKQKQKQQKTRINIVNYYTKRTYTPFLLLLLLLLLLSLFITNYFVIYSARAQQTQSITPNNDQVAPPMPVQSASYVSIDGLTLVIIFDRPLNLSASIESVEQRHAAAAAAAYESESRALGTRHNKLQHAAKNTTSGNARATNKLKLKKKDSLASAASSPQSEVSFLTQRARHQQQAQTCIAQDQEAAAQETPHLIGGVQLCAQLLSRKTLKLLHKHKLFSCLWASQVQFLIQLGKPIGGGGGGGGGSGGSPTASRGVRVTFRRGTLSATLSGSAGWNEQEVSVELSKLPLEGLGVPLSPRLALTGPNQVPPCGQFSISAHLSSPHGTQSDESVRLRWSVERRGMIATASNSSSAPLTSSSQMVVLTAASSQQPEVVELQWQALRQMVARERTNHLVLDARLLQFVPQLYEFRLEASFTSSTTTFNLNASHQMGRLDFDTPIGTIYGSHLLALDQQLNTNQDLGLMADVQVPECARNIKQVGLYWQVSDPRVRFEQTYAPFYLANSGSLPEQALIEFRLILFYGIRVKKFASAGTLVPTGESLLDAQISDGLLMASVGQPQDLIGGGAAPIGGGGSGDSTSTGANLELFAISRDRSAREQLDKFTYQWSCFDGKTAQPCHKSLKLQASSGGTRYDVGTPGSKALLARPQTGGELTGGISGGGGGVASSLADGGQQSPLLLVDRARQRQATLKLPLSWLDSDAQLWFGLQRFDRANPSQHSKTEYALVTVHPVQSSLHEAQSSQQPVVAVAISIGPVLIGRSRQRATIRNPLTGAIVLIANAPALIVGRLSAGSGDSFTWRSPNYPHPLHWTTRNVTNPLNGQEEILTELHLDQEMLLAHAHHQIQLSVCSTRNQRDSTASVSLDVVQGVTHCRVELASSSVAERQQALNLLSSQMGKPQIVSGSADQEELPLVVTVNYCNIPLGLSPVTYQLYIIDTSASDGFVANPRGGGGGGGGGASGSSSASSQPEQEDEDYMNEADVQFYETQAQPLSVPQLSPVFSLGAMSALTLAGITSGARQPTPDQDSSTPPPPQASGSGATRIRFAVRVCDRLPSCKMFYSSSIDPLALLKATIGAGSSTQPQINGAALNQSSLALGLATSAASIGQAQRLRVATADESQQVAIIRALVQMLESAKRANTAGNSIAAISIVNAVVQMGQRRLAALDDDDNDDNHNHPSGKKTQSPATSSVRYSNEREPEDEAENRTNNNNKMPSQNDQQQQKLARGQLRELMQQAMRDCLHYGTRSIQRHFHYTESGQTNLVLAAMSRIIASPLAGFELKFRSLRLVVMLVRKTLDLVAGSAPADSLDQHVARLAGRSAPDFKTLQQAYESLFSTLAQHSVKSEAAVVVALGRHQHQQPESESPQTDENEKRQPSKNNENSDLSEGASSAHEEMLAQAAHKQQVSPLKAAGRRNQEEPILAYLKLARTAHKALLQSAASQLALGAIQSFEFQSPGGNSGALGKFALAPSNPQLPIITSSTNNNNNNNNNNFVEAAKFLASEQPAALITSSLTHQTSLLDSQIDLNLREFGQVSVLYGASLSSKLARLMRMARLRCRASISDRKNEDDQFKCSSFVLALTSYAGKAPFRSLDSITSSSEVNKLRVPIVHVDWLSPLDGTSLIELLRNEKSLTATGGGDYLLSLDDFRSRVTFTLPAGGDISSQSGVNVEPYKCYKFDEYANEWTLSAAPLSSSSRTEQITPAPITDGAGAQSEQTQVIECAYDGYGALGAFRGRPPSSVDTPMELSIAVGVGLVLAAVSILSILGCMASKAKKRRQNDARRQGSDEMSSSGSSSAAASSSYGNEDDDNDAGGTRQRHAGELPHHLAGPARPRYR